MIKQIDHIINKKNTILSYNIPMDQEIINDLNLVGIKYYKKHGKNYYYQIK